MNVKRLKQLLEGLDDSVEVTVEVRTFEDQIASVPLSEVRDDVVGEIILSGSEQGVA